MAWQKARVLCVDIFDEFKDCKNYSFKNQIERAVVSVMNNIAEGFERNGNKEFRNFLYISKGSIAEVRSMLYLGKDLKYLSDSRYQELLSRSIEIARLLSGLIKTL